MGFVIEDHERGQVFQICEDAAFLIAAVQHVQIVARTRSGRQWQDALHHFFGIGGLARCLDFTVLKRLTFLRQHMPVGNGDDPARRNLAANVLFGADRTLDEAEHFITIGVRNEQLLEDGQVRDREVPLAVAFLAHEGIKQPVVNDQAGCNDEEILGEAGIVRRAVGVENLPDHEGLQHPGLASARCHLEAVFGISVFRRADDLGIPRAHQQYVRRGNLVEVLQRGNAQHLMGIDNVEQGLPLSGVEIERPGILKFGLKPPFQQFRRDLGNLIEDRSLAGLQTRAGVLGLGRQALGKRKIIDARHHATSITASASKPNTSTTRTQTRRVLPFFGRPVR